MEDTRHRIIFLIFRHAARYPKIVPEGWPLEKEITSEKCSSGALTDVGSRKS
jgi:hypothetical protein